MDKISKKKMISNLNNIQKANLSGKNRHIGKKNPRWNGGNRLKGHFPCPQCGIDRICEKRNAYRICHKCHAGRPKEFDKKKWSKATQEQAKGFAIRYKGGKCEMCGASDLPNCCYHFHHKNPDEKDFLLGTKFHQKMNGEIIKELDKCTLLCANCHSILHWNKR